MVARVKRWLFWGAVLGFCAFEVAGAVVTGMSHCGAYQTCKVAFP